MQVGLIRHTVEILKAVTFSIYREVVVQHLEHCLAKQPLQARYAFMHVFRSGFLSPITKDHLTPVPRKPPTQLEAQASSH